MASWVRHSHFRVLQLWRENYESWKNSTPNYFFGLKIGRHFGKTIFHNRMLQIFDILSFWKNMGSFVAEKWDFLRFSLFLRRKAAIFFQKLKISKICNMRLWRTIFPGSEPIFSLSFFHFEPFFNNKKLDFGGDFPIQICKNAHVGASFVASYLCRRFDSWPKWAHSGK